MNKNIFLDTNILIYAYSISEVHKKNKSIELLEHRNIVLSIQVINEFVWVMSRKYNVDLFKLDIIVKNLFDTYTVVLIDRKIIELAIKLAIKYNISYTEDLQHGQIINNDLTILNPFKNH
jgi:predicted nucleic acid-binding protein